MMLRNLNSRLLHNSTHDTTQIENSHKFTEVTKIMVVMKKKLHDYEELSINEGTRSLLC